MDVITLIAIAALPAYFFYKRSQERGVRFVKAYYFLEVLSMGETVDTANQMAGGLFKDSFHVDVDRKIIISAKSYSKQHHGGKQLPVIEDARSKGFGG